MALDQETIPARPDPAEEASSGSDVMRDRPGAPTGTGFAPPRPAPSPRPRRRRLSRRQIVRLTLLMLLPIALVIGGYWYVTGGRDVSTYNAYVDADKVGVSTDVSGIVKEIDVQENESVAAGQVLFRLDDRPFRYALDKAQAQVGMVREDLNALKANYRDMKAQIKQAEDDIDYYQMQFDRQQKLLSTRVTSRSTYDTAHRDLQNAQQKLVSLTQQLAAIAANLNDDAGWAGRGESALPRGDGAARRGRPRARPHDREGALRRRRDGRPLAGGRQVAAGLHHRLLSRRHGPCLGRREPEGDAAHLCAARAAA